MKRSIKIFTVAACLLFLNSCSDEVKKKLFDFPNDVTFEQGDGINIGPEHLSYLVPDAPYSASAYLYGTITMNVKKNSDGTHTGFALSRKNYRSYPWTGSLPQNSTPTAVELRAAADSSIFSVYTARTNLTETFTVVRIDGDEAYFTIDKPRTVEHILVANTNYNYMLLTYGSVYSSVLNETTQIYEEYNSNGDYAIIRNPNLPDPATTKFRVWNMPDVYNFGGGNNFIRLEGHESLYGIKGYVKLTAIGYNGGTKVGESDYYIAVMEGGAPAPYEKWNIIQNQWARWELSSLGEVDKVVFHMDSSDKDPQGRMRTPPYFCMDGVRLK